MGSVLERLKERQERLGPALYAAVLSLIVLAVTGIVGIVAHLPWLFPSLGPTVMLFFESPQQRASRPLNALTGHGLGLVAGVLCAYAFGLTTMQSATSGGLSWAHVLSGALSIALTTLVLTFIRMPHPPAGATTLIVSLGILTTTPQLLSMAGAIALVTVLGWGINMALGTRPVS